MSLFNELKRRNVFKVTIAYIVTSWLVAQVAELAADSFGAPDWVMKMLITLLALGLPLAVLLAWAFELTPEGIKKEKDVDRNQSITTVTGQKLNHTIIALLVLALGYFATDKFLLSQPEPAQREAAEPETAQDEGPTTIAVLPFVNMSDDSANEYFSDGLTEELLNILAKIKELHVAGRTSSFAFKGKQDDLRVIGEKLNVSTILEGSVRKDDSRNRVRITAQLINVENGYHLWSETFDRDLNDIFALQEEVAKEVAKALRVTLLGEDIALAAPAPTTGFNAYDHYLRGLQGLNEYSFASLGRAVDDFQTALTLDPSYSPAQIGLITTWQSLADIGAMTRQEAVDMSLPLLTLVKQREPDNSDVYVLQAWIETIRKERQAADESYREALARNPRNVTALLEYGGFLRNREQIDQGIEYILRAIEIEPYSIKAQWEACWSYMWTKNLRAALQTCAKIREIEPDNPMGYYGASMAYRLDGQLDQAVYWDTRAHEVDPDDHELAAELANMWLSLGDLEMMEQWLGVAESLGPGQLKPLASKALLLMQREQAGLAAEVAYTTLERENRMFSRSILRNAFVSNALKQGKTDEALEAYRIDNAGVLEIPPELDAERTSWSVASLVEMAVIMKSGKLASARAEEVLQFAETILEGAHPKLVPWLAELNWAAVKNVRGDTAGALQHIRLAYEQGFRLNWRYKLQHWFVLENLHDEPEYRDLVAMFERDMEHQRENTYELLGISK